MSIGTLNSRKKEGDVKQKDLSEKYLALIEGEASSEASAITYINQFLDELGVPPVDDAATSIADANSNDDESLRMENNSVFCVKQKGKDEVAASLCDKDMSTKSASAMAEDDEDEEAMAMAEYQHPTCNSSTSNCIAKANFQDNLNPAQSSLTETTTEVFECTDMFMISIHGLGAVLAVVAILVVMFSKI